MTRLEFLKGMKNLANYYLKDLNEDQLNTWYGVFKDIDTPIFYMAVQSYGKNNRYFPVVSELVEEIHKQTVVYYKKLVTEGESQNKKYLLDMIDWYELQKEFPKHIVDEIYQCKNIGHTKQAYIENNVGGNDEKIN